jgi:F-type H+-transporting ATPase subunit b
MFNWWTFFFQIINFFVVLYILYKLFFNPLKRVIQKRDELLSKRLEEVEAGESKLKEQEQAYQEKLQEIDILKGRELSIARKEAQDEKKRLLEQADKEIEKERLKQGSILELERKEVERTIKEQSIYFGMDYVKRFAEELMDEEMHHKLIEKFFDELKRADTHEIEMLKKEIKTKKCKIKLTTALKVEEKTIHTIKDTLEHTLNINIASLESFVDSDLIGGIKLEIENKILDGSIQKTLEQLKEEAVRELS